MKWIIEYPIMCYKMKKGNAEKWIKLLPLVIGVVITYCLLWYVIPQNKGGGVAALWVAAILLFFTLLRFIIGKNEKRK